MSFYDRLSWLQWVTPKSPIMVGQLSDLQGIPQIVVASSGQGTTPQAGKDKKHVAGDPTHQFHLYKCYLKLIELHRSWSTSITSKHTLQKRWVNVFLWNPWWVYHGSSLGDFPISMHVGMLDPHRTNQHCPMLTTHWKNCFNLIDSWPPKTVPPFKTTKPGRSTVGLDEWFKKKTCNLSNTSIRS